MQEISQLLPYSGGRVIGGGESGDTDNIVCNYL